MQSVSELFSGVEIVKTNIDLGLGIDNLTFNSADKLLNTMYFSLKKDKTDIEESITNGAIAIVCEEFFDQYPCIQVENIRKAMSLISSNFYDNAHKKLHIIGVVGTNGKTTTTRIVAHILRSNNMPAAVVGTLGTDLNGEFLASNLTTPDPIELHRIFQTVYAKGIKYVVMEISAHAIYFEKMYGVVCDYVIFTNITQDHLDFFGDMSNYANTKLNYINNQNAEVAVVNADDIYGARIINDNKIFTLTYGLKNPCDVFAIDVEYSNAKTYYIVNAYDKIFQLEVPLLGEFNVYNTLAAVATAIAIGVDENTVIDALKYLPEVPGRFNILNSDITVIIDYAHTPDGLENVLRTAKNLANKDIITVFGCGGNRDKTKRPIMGEISAKYSNLSIITSDNPRMEKPIDIINEIAEGYKRINKNYIKITDRAKAIDFAVRIAEKGDIVLIAGKGAEEYIDEQGTKRPYSDKQTAQNAIRRFRIDKVDN